MLFRLSLALEVTRGLPQGESSEGFGTSAQVEQAREHTGPSMGFRIPDAEPEWADRK